MNRKILTVAAIAVSAALMACQDTPAPGPAPTDLRADLRESYDLYAAITKSCHADPYYDGSMKSEDASPVKMREADAFIRESLPQLLESDKAALSLSNLDAPRAKRAYRDAIDRYDEVSVKLWEICAPSYRKPHEWPYLADRPDRAEWLDATLEE